MRKAKTPPKRKPVPAGRRAAKRKVEKGPRAEMGKVGKVGKMGKIGKVGKVARAAKVGNGSAVGKKVSKAAGGGNATRVGKVAAGAKAENRPKATAKAAASSAKASGKSSVNKPATPTNATAAAKAPPNPPAKAMGSRPRSVAAPSAAAGHGVTRVAKDSKKTAAERANDKAAPGVSGAPARSDGAGTVAVSPDKPVEPSAPATLPTPIASFTI